MILRPLTARFGRPAPVETVELEPGCEWELPPPLFLPDELERITGHATGLDPAANIATMTTRTYWQGPTRKHLWRDAIIADRTVMGKGRIAVLDKAPRRAILTASPRHIDEAAMCSTSQTEAYFGHWLLDGLCHELLGGGVTLETKAWPHKAGYRELAGLPAHPVDYARVERLWMLEDHELNRGRVARLRDLRRRIAPRHGPLECVMIARGKSGVGRVLENEGDLGFPVIHPESMTAAEIAATLSRARLVIGVEGSALAHAIVAMPEGAGLLVIQPPNAFNSFYRPMCGMLGIRFGFTVADRPFRMDHDRLIRAVDLFG